MNQSRVDPTRDDIFFYRTFTTIQDVLSGFTFICILIGNSLTISAIIKYKWLRNKTNYLLFSLAIADILVGITTQIRIIFHQVIQHSCDWYALSTIIISLLGTMAYEISSIHIIVIAWERHLAVTRPFDYHSMTMKTLYCAILVPWMLPIMIAIISFGIISHIGIKNVCANWYQLWSVADISINLLCYITGAVLMVVMSLRVMRVLKKHLKDIQSLAVGDCECNRTISKSELKATKMLATVAAAYLTAWLPHFILGIVILSGVYMNPKVIFGLSAATVYIGYNNSAINVLLYAIGHKDFKKAYMYLISCTRNIDRAHESR